MSSTGPAEPPPAVYTIGHGAAGCDSPKHRSHAERIATSVDVRSETYSVHTTDFIKGSREELHTKASLGYHWLSNKLRARLTSQPLHNISKRQDYEDVELSAAFQSEIAELRGLAGGPSVVVMCTDLDPTNCLHTLLVVPELART